MAGSRLRRDRSTPGSSGGCCGKASDRTPRPTAATLDSLGANAALHKTGHHLMQSPQPLLGQSTLAQHRHPSLASYARDPSCGPRFHRGRQALCPRPAPQQRAPLGAVDAGRGRPRALYLARRGAGVDRHGPQCRAAGEHRYRPCGERRKVHEQRRCRFSLPTDDYLVARSCRMTNFRR
jgi:hypothetical protein